jgi:DNA-binding NarL/FixJ family response regulator
MTLPREAANETREKSAPPDAPGPAPTALAGKGPRTGVMGAQEPLRIIVADDHEFIRRGVRGLLEARGWKVVAEATNGREAIEKTAQLLPDVLILDIAMPLLNGLDAARQIRKRAPKTEILILSMHDSEQLVRSVLTVGIRGYVLKADAAHNLVAAVEALARHKPFFTSNISRILLDAYLKDTVDAEALTPRLEEPTTREREIIQLLAEGKSNKEIADILDVTVKTVETHRSNLMRKLDLHSLADVIRYAIRNRLVEA